MKKIILFTVVLYVLFLVSFKENSREPESFAKILKEHPERMQELLKVADTYKDTGEIYTLSSDDILSPEQLKIFRKKMSPKPGRFWSDVHPVITIPTQALHELIKNHLNSKDSVVFYLGTYSKKDTIRIRRYNERNAKEYFAKGKSPYNYKKLKNRPAFAMQVFSNGYSETKNSKKNYRSLIYEISRLCPPPPEGCFEDL